MEKKEFKAESKRLLDLMINSIYTHREIFLRELISNASDATDKLYYNALKDGNTGVNRDALAITIALDKEKRELVLTDRGCGMTQEELENNLGTIAKSGSLDFKKNMDEKQDVDIIGQFGVGFYAAFMVSHHVKVISKAFGSNEGFCWESDGAEGYTITPCQKDEAGTEIILYIKDNTEEDNYDEFLEEYRIKGIVKKYSDYIRYPIEMEVTKSRKKEEGEEFEQYKELETLNSMVPIWKKDKNKVSEEDYNLFYQDKFYDYENPVKVIRTSTEGSATYHALMFIPSAAPYNYYTRDFEKGLQLYANGVMIMEKCGDLLPDYFSFVKGLVDSQDLSLNISREMLQHDRQLKVIASSLQKKIKGELLSLLKNDREKYDKFFQNFGLQLKYGMYGDYGVNKDILKDLILFYSSTEEKLVTLEEYVSRIKETQEFIYYACGDSVQKISKLPQIELLKDKGYEILYLTDDVDEFALKVLNEYDGKRFKSISDNDLGLETEEEKQEAEKKSEDNKGLFDCLKDGLIDKVSGVRLSSRLKTHPVCLSTQGEITLEMEKVLNAMPNNEQKIKAQRVLEINENHPIFKTLCKLYETDKEKVKTYGDILYTQALIMEGISIEDPVAYANAVCALMTEEK